MARFNENLKSLATLAGDGDSHDPTRLFAGISELFLSDDHPPSAQDRAAFAEILRRLLPSVDVAERKRVAGALARRSDAAPEFIRLLAADEIAVARPLLETSAKLTEDDLTTIIRYGSSAHRQAISTRRGLSRRIKTELIAAEADAEALAPSPQGPYGGGRDEDVPALKALEAKLSGRKRTISEDVDKARAFLSKIDKGRHAKTTLSLLERAAEQGLFADSKRKEDELTPEARARAESFLAEIDGEAEAVETPSAKPLRLPTKTVVDPHKARAAEPRKTESKADAEMSAAKTRAAEPKRPRAPVPVESAPAKQIAAPLKTEREAREKAVPAAQPAKPTAPASPPREKEKPATLVKPPAQRAMTDYARAAADWAFEINPDGVIVFLSDDAAAALGRPAATLMGKKLYDIGAFTGEGFDARRARDAMARRIPFRDQIFQLSGDRPSAWLIGAVPVFDLKSGRFRGYRGTASRIAGGRAAPAVRSTKTEDLASAVRQASAKAAEKAESVAAEKEALENRGGRLAAMSHELRTPLNAIMGFAEVMAEEILGPLDGKYRTYAKGIFDSATHVNQVINDVLDRTKLDAGAVTVRPEPVALSVLLEAAVKATAREAASREIDLSYVSTDTAFVVDADEARARQVLTSVVRAMISLTKEHGRLGLETERGEGGLAEINIWNDGPALSPETALSILPKVSDSFAEADPTKLGLALTLSVARDLARLMGGDVALQSRKGVGNRFIVTFPLAGAPAKTLG